MTEQIKHLEEKLIKLQNELEALKNKEKLEEEKYAALIDELHMANTRIEKMNIELKLANEKATESDRLKSAFLANISHEIRTPMNGIIGFSEMLLSKDIQPEKREYFARIIIKSGQKLLSIVNDILDVSKIEAGQIEIKIEPVCINQVIDELYLLYFNQNDKPDMLIMNTKGLPDVASIIRTDKTKIFQILNNLINNAVKYTKQGCIEFGYTLQNDLLEFFVQDSGIGISSEYQQVVFNYFRQADMEDTRLFGGTGLGLSISKKLVEILGGKIWLTSEPGQGTVFYFTLPYNPVQTDLVSVPKTVSALKPEIKGEYTILIAEPDDLNFQYLKEILTECKIHIIRAIDGLEAVRLVYDNPNIKFILIDMKMPVMSGIEAIKLIKANYKDIPIVAQSNYILPSEKELALNEGCVDYVSKYTDRQKIIQWIAPIKTDHKNK